ncbi:hypothetical protein K440DRAFT_644316 [Wilcoxina mikolae CBS 423.85]|nr:hypothetical protein K440DRAFT_644316 [Wilcoxina mikolae CBS 423.85]
MMRHNRITVRKPVLAVKLPPELPAEWKEGSENIVQPPLNVDPLQKMLCSNKTLLYTLLDDNGKPILQDPKPDVAENELDKIKQDYRTILVRNAKLTNLLDPQSDDVPENWEDSLDRQHLSWDDKGLKDTSVNKDDGPEPEGEEDLADQEMESNQEEEPVDQEMESNREYVMSCQEVKSNRKDTSAEQDIKSKGDKASAEEEVEQFTVSFREELKTVVTTLPKSREVNSKSARSKYSKAHSRRSSSQVTNKGGNKGKDTSLAVIEDGINITLHCARISHPYMREDVRELENMLMLLAEPGSGYSSPLSSISTPIDNTLAENEEDKIERIKEDSMSPTTEGYDDYFAWLDSIPEVARRQTELRDMIVYHMANHDHAPTSIFHEASNRDPARFWKT